MELLWKRGEAFGKVCCCKPVVTLKWMRARGAATRVELFLGAWSENVWGVVWLGFE